MWFFHSKTQKTKFFLQNFLSLFESNFDRLSKAFILEGTDTGQIVARPFLSDHYFKLFWAEMLFILRFWVQDESPEYDKTDAAIEKSVAFIFDFMEEGIFDTAFDFGKFLLFGK